MSEIDETKDLSAPLNPVATLAALLDGDRFINADACALLLGMEKDGKANRDGFMRNIASLPDFPKPLELNSRSRSWLRSEVMTWARNQRRAA